MGGSDCKFAQCGLPHRRAVHIFAGIHEGQDGAEDARFQFIGHREAARSHIDKQLASARNLFHELDLPLVAGDPESSFPPHFRAFLLDEKGEVQHAHMLPQQAVGHGDSATFGAAHLWHGRSGNFF